MEMTDKLSKLIILIVKYINDRDSYVTKTKLLKLLYLFDVEYFRVYRETFTGFDWRFYHLGPWTAQYEEELNNLIDNSLLKTSFGRNDAVFFKTYEKVDFPDLFNTYKDELPLKLVLQTWAEKTTNEILDYVYFETEPMIFGKRNELLDFSTISENPPIKYKRSSSGKTPKQIQEARKKLDAISEKYQAKSENKKDSSLSEYYDEDFFAAMTILEEMDS
jgi:hypothetical protein